MNRHVIRIHQHFLKLVVKIIDRLCLIPAANGKAGKNLRSQNTLETRRVHFLRCCHAAQHRGLVVFFQRFSTRVTEPKMVTGLFGNGIRRQCDSQLFIGHLLSSKSLFFVICKQR